MQIVLKRFLLLSIYKGDPRRTYLLPNLTNFYVRWSITSKFWTAFLSLRLHAPTSFLKMQFFSHNSCRVVEKNAYVFLICCFDASKYLFKNVFNTQTIRKMWIVANTRKFALRVSDFLGNMWSQKLQPLNLTDFINFFELLMIN